MSKYSIINFPDSKSGQALYVLRRNYDKKVVCETNTLDKAIEELTRLENEDQPQIGRPMQKRKK